MTDADLRAMLDDIHESKAGKDVRVRAQRAISDLAAEVLRLRAALAFYADRDGTGYSIDMRDYGLGMDVGPIIKDGGEIARAALGDAP